MSQEPLQEIIILGGSGAGPTGVTAPAVIADNAVVRGDGGARATQGSSTTISDEGKVVVAHTDGTVSAPVFPLDIKAVSTGDASSGFANLVRFLLRDSANVDNVMGYTGFSRNGFDNFGAWVVHTNNGTTINERMRMSAAGVLQVGGTTDLGIGLLHVHGDFASTGISFFRGANKRVTTQFDKTSDTTLSDIPGISVTLVGSGNTYGFRAVLHTVSPVGSGVKFAIGGTATLTAINIEAITHDAGTVVAQSRATAKSTAVGAATAVTAALCTIEGTCVCSSAGTLTVQFAQNASDATPSSVLVGSKLEVLGF